jgi:hypothetical protein
VEFGQTRCLVTSEPQFIEPKPGNWPVLREFLNRMPGDEQLPYFLGWMKVALEMLGLRLGSRARLWSSVVNPLRANRSCPPCWRACLEVGHLGSPIDTCREGPTLTVISSSRSF